MPTLSAIRVPILLAAEGFDRGIGAVIAKTRELETSANRIGQNVGKPFMVAEAAVKALGSALVSPITNIGAFFKGLDQTSNVLEPFKMLPGVVGGAFGVLSAGLGAVGAAFTTVITTAEQLGGVIGNVATTAIDAAGKWERVEATFTRLTGSVDAGQTALEGLSRMSATSPVSLDALTGASQRLQVFGYQAGTAEKMLGRLQNVAAAMPGDVSNNLEKLVNTITRVTERGKVTDITLRPLMTAGIPISQMLGERLGVSAGELRQRMKAGDVLAGDVVNAILNAGGPGGRFGSAAAAQAETYEGLWVQVANRLQLTYQKLGGALIGSFELKDIPRGLADSLTAIRAAIDDWRPAIMLVGQAFLQVRDIGAGALQALAEGINPLKAGFDDFPDKVLAVRVAVIDFAEAVAKAFSQADAYGKSLAGTFVNKIILPIMEFRSQLGAAATVIPMPGDAARLEAQKKTEQEWRNLGTELQLAAKAGFNAPTPGIDAFARQQRMLAGMAAVRQSPLGVFAEQFTQETAFGGAIRDAFNMAGGKAGGAFRAGLKDPLGGVKGDIVGALKDFRPEELAEKAKTPFEKLQENITRMSGIAGLSPDVFSRLAGGEFLNIAKGLDLNRAPGAALLGSREAQDTMARFRNRTEQTDVPNLLRQMLAGNAKRDAYLKVMADALVREAKPGGLLDQKKIGPPGAAPGAAGGGNAGAAGF